MRILAVVTLQAKPQTCCGAFTLFQMYRRGKSRNPLRRACSSRRCPLSGFINLGTPDAMARYVAAFRNALSEALGCPTGITKLTEHNPERIRYILGIVTQSRIISTARIRSSASGRSSRSSWDGIGRNLIKIWVAKYEAGGLDSDTAAADAPESRAQSMRWAVLS